MLFICWRSRRTIKISYSPHPCWTITVLMIWKQSHLHGWALQTSIQSFLGSECASFHLGFFLQRDSCTRNFLKTVSFKFREIYFRVPPWTFSNMILDTYLAWSSGGSFCCFKRLESQLCLRPSEPNMSVNHQGSQFHKCMCKITTNLMINWEKCDCQMCYGQTWYRASGHPIIRGSL